MGSQDEFPEIAHSGGKITLDVEVDEQGNVGYSMGYSHSRPTPVTLIQVYALPQGVPVERMSSVASAPQFSHLRSPAATPCSLAQTARVSSVTTAPAAGSIGEADLGPTAAHIARLPHRHTSSYLMRNGGLWLAIARPCHVRWIRHKPAKSSLTWTRWLMPSVGRVRSRPSMSPSKGSSASFSVRSAASSTTFLGDTGTARSVALGTI